MLLKLTVKTLQQKQFQIDVDPNSKVSDIKQKIEETQGHAVNLQKLIFSGKILLDDQSLASYNIVSEKDFLVLMVSKPKPSTSSIAGPSSVTASTPSPAPSTTPAPAPAADIVATASTAPPTSAAPAPAPVSAPVSSPAVPAAAETGSTTYDPTGVATGQIYESAVQNMMEMGFDRAQVQRAMRASFNNPERAVEYLMTGIPGGLGIEQQPAVSAAPPPQRSPATVPTQQIGNIQNLFSAASQQAPAQQQPQQASGPASDLSFLQSQPQFQQLRQLVQANPALLQHLLQQLGQSNPDLLQLINANQQAFLRLLNDDGEPEGEGGAPPGAQYIQVTQEEKAAIDRLEALGFDRALVIEAYFACEKNEEIAANYLFEHGNEEEWQ